ncbi:sigma-70 family RNA polymerase sigma factor [Modestobacter sp. I12A-02628]|uniref:RNA polymerase sigma factor n=1 Tax=Goekera deserti TaxID=2497753 RepID=A0A7K3WIC4_9ACTN|nr:sigma-70 family RNA polymerase sigma factor [Goekera deserti]MPQ96341.1 sigma-70 family RNA polymerase sigma factor [Goekera deserti]NDI50509.1 sigma-70 family RNA polymerase sigma factor [Goekera deserti]NEL56177.1 sigma-70 family RNA polymerase sigma factor [Goekera deserti]
MARHRPAQTEALDVQAAYAAHGPELYRFALRQLGDGGAAQDVVQEVFLRAWRAADSYDPELSGLRTWLFAIARNVVVDEARRFAVRPWQRDLTDGSDVTGPADTGVTDRLVDAWVVEEALRRIGEDHRVAIVQTHLRGRPHGEVAAELGIPVGTLRSRVFYGLKALRLAMEEMGVEP